MGSYMGIPLSESFLGHVYPVSLIKLGLIYSIFNGLVAPVPVIQVINLLDGLFILALEWPLPLIKDKPFQRSFGLRFALYPIMAVAALLQYQCTDPGFYLLIGTAYVVLFVLVDL